MRTLAALHAISAAAVLALPGACVSAAPVTVFAYEDWNGYTNPHEAEGVGLEWSGWPDDPAVYTIPDGLTITGGGAIRLSADLEDVLDNLNITFVFENGDLHIEDGGFIETSLANRADNRQFLLDLGGGSVTGAGRIVGLRAEGPRNRKPRAVLLQNVTNVDLRDVDLHVEDTSSEIPNPLTILAAGYVRIPGMIDVRDTDNRGNPVSDIRIDAGWIEIGGIDTRSYRPEGRASGSITLRALSPAAGYDPASAANQFANHVAVNGPIRTDGFGGGGHVSIFGVVLKVGGSFDLLTAPGSTVALNAGLDSLGTPGSELAVDAAGAGITPLVAFSVNWDGAAPAGSPPAFTTDPVLRVKALPNTPYAAVLAGAATDPDGDVLTYERGQGPAWLSVDPDGSLWGTPADSDAGMNSWTISVTDGTRFDVATLRIGVSGRPTFFFDPIEKPAGTQGQPYNGTLADSAGDPDGDPITFAKVDGPAWLSVAANGALTGTPPASSSGTNEWTVSVSDASGSDTARLLIVISGAPRWLTDPVVKVPARSGISYGAVGQTLAVNAEDPDAEPIQFVKVSGPAWLQVAVDGALSGTPSDADIGQQSWVVRASDPTRSSEATLQIEVLAAGAARVIMSTEIWDGVQNPHAYEGVTLQGAGTLADPAVYTIPGGLRFTSTGAIQMTYTGGPDKSIVLAVTNGDIAMAPGSSINLARLQREGLQTCVFDLGGGNIIGEGQILGLLIDRDSPRALTIRNVNDVALAAIDLHVLNANNGPRDMVITASGSVAIPRIDLGDRDGGGNPVGSVIVEADRILIGSVDVRSMRTDSYRGNGNILLTALGAPGDYDPANAAANDFGNQLVVGGSLLSRGPIPSVSPGSDGNVTLTGVAVRLAEASSVEVPDGSTITIDAGVVRGGATAGDLFEDLSGSGLAAQHVVQWNGGVTAPGAPILSAVKPFAATALRIEWLTDDLMATEFFLEQSTDGAGFAEVASLPGWARRTEVGGLAADQMYFYRLRGQNAAGTSAYSDTGSAKTPAWGINVNFASLDFGDGVPGYPVAGYLDDYGDVYDDRGNGYTYGWLEDNWINARFRDAGNSPDARYDTLTHLQRTTEGQGGGDMVWEVAVPNGPYQVHIVAGDPTATDNMLQFNVETRITQAKQPSVAAGNWVEFVQECTVADGRLTIRSGPQASNNKICFVDIATAAVEPVEPPEITSISLSGGNVTIQWTGGGTLQSAPSLAPSSDWTDLGSGGSWSGPAPDPARFYRVLR